MRESQKVLSTRALFIIAGVILAVSLIGSGFALLDRFNQTNSRRHEQAIINAKFSALSVENCHEIEDLKMAQRQQAIEDYADLHRNLRLLHLAPTPEILQTALDKKNQRVAHFKAKACPRKTEVKKP